MCNLCSDKQYCLICEREAEEEEILRAVGVVPSFSVQETDFKTIPANSQFKHRRKKNIFREKDIVSITEFNNKRIKVRTSAGLFCCERVGKTLKVIKVLRTKSHKKAEEKFSLKKELFSEEVAIGQERPQDDWRKALMTITVGEFLDIWSAA